MSRSCELTGKAVQSGNNVSHANNRTRRRFLPNLCNVTLISDALGQRYRLRISANALRTVEHRGGLDAFLAKAKDGELSMRARLLKRQIAKKIVEKSGRLIQPDCALIMMAGFRPAFVFFRWWHQPRIKKMRMTLPLLPFMAVMAAVVVASNFLVQFPVDFTLGALNLADLLTWGAFTYPVAFLVTDLANRRFGPSTARLVVFCGFIVAVALSVWLATPRIAVASGSAFLAAQLLDVSIFDRLRNRTWWLPPLASTIIGSSLDTLIFFQSRLLAVCRRDRSGRRLCQRSRTASGPVRRGSPTLGLLGAGRPDGQAARRSRHAGALRRADAGPDPSGPGIVGLTGKNDFQPGSKSQPIVQIGPVAQTAWSLIRRRPGSGTPKPGSAAGSSDCHLKPA